MSSEQASPEDLGDEALDEAVVLEDPGAELVDDLDELGVLAKERDEFREMAQRLQADFENYKKRVARQGDELAARQVVSLISSLLPVLDALELAQAHVAEGEASVEAQALVQARNLLVDTLVKQGLEELPGQGCSFDPQVHDAVAHAEGDSSESEPVIDEVLRAGYAWRGHVVRPAMVRVKG
jgi:molecular chaperone GrpE